MSEAYFVDTNIFLRYLTNDIPEQAAVFEEALRKAARGEIRLVTSPLTIAEIVWTLESFYHLDRQAIQRNILAIASTDGLEVEDGELVMQAVIWYAEKNVDYIDAYHAAWLLDRGVDTVLTFDMKHFSRLEGVRAVQNYNGGFHRQNVKSG